VSHRCGTLLLVTVTRTRALRVRLDVNDVQAGLLLRRAGARRVAYNWAVEVLRHNGRTWRRQIDAGVEKADRVKVPSHFDLIRRWTGADDLPACRDLVCRDRETGESWWADHPAQMFEAALKDARENYAKFLRGEARPPRFLSRHRDLPRFRVRSSIKLEPGRLSFQGSDGWLRVAHACPEQATLRRLVRRDKASIKTVTVKRDRLGSWWATITYTREVARPAQPAPGPVVGVDVGVKTLAVAATSDGTIVAETASTSQYRAELRRLRRAQRVVSRRTRPGKRVKQSANRAKAQRKVAILHDRIRSRRANDLHHASKATIDAAVGGVVVVEDLNVAGMKAKKPGAGAAGRGFNRAVSDQGFGELRRQLTYKADTAGVTLLVAPRFFPSSKTCARCGVVRPKLLLAERTFTCEACGHTADRDVNAACNLAAWGERELGMAEDVTCQDGDRDLRGSTATPGDGEPMWHACGPASAGHQKTSPEQSGQVVGGGTGRDETGTRQPQASPPRRQCGTSRPGTATTRRDGSVTTRS
jgi:putative transposase